MLNRSWTFFILILLSFIAKSQDFNQGYYYDSNGLKTTGLLHFEYSQKRNTPGKVLFKRTTESIEKELMIDSLMSFVIEEDNFVVVKNFRTSLLISYEKDYAEVFEDGPVCLYKHIGLVTRGSRFNSQTGYIDLGTEQIITLLVGLKNEQNVEKLEMNRRKKMIKQLEKYIGDNEELIKEAKKTPFISSPQFIVKYNMLFGK